MLIRRFSLYYDIGNVVFTCILNQIKVQVFGVEMEIIVYWPNVSAKLERGAIKAFLEQGGATKVILHLLDLSVSKTETMSDRKLIK